MATVDITNWDRKKKIAVDSNATSLNSAKPVQLELDGSASDGKTGNGTIGYDTSEIDTSSLSAKKQSVVFTQSDESTTRDYIIENPEDLGTNNIVTVHILGNYSADGTVQVVFGYGSGDGTDYEGSGIFSENAAYLFDDKTNVSGNSVGLTATGSPTSTTGIFETAFNYDGDDYHGSDTDFAPDTSEDVVFEFWIKKSSTPSNDFDNALIAVDDGSEGVAVYVNTSGVVFFASRGANNSGQSGTNVCDGNWHHVIAEFEQGSFYRVYVDGAQDYETSITDDSGISNTPLQIGANGQGGNPHTGDIDLPRFRFGSSALKDAAASAAEFEASAAQSTTRSYFSQQAGESTGTTPGSPVTQDGFEDGDFTNSPKWTASGTVNVQSATNVKNGTNSAELQSNANLALDRGSSNSIADGDIFQMWMYAPNNDAQSTFSYSYNLENPSTTDGDRVEIYYDGSDWRLRTFDGSGTQIADTSIVSSSTNAYYLLEIEFDTDNNNVAGRVFDSSSSFLGEVTAQNYSETTTFNEVKVENNVNDTIYADDVSYKSQSLVQTVSLPVTSGTGTTPNPQVSPGTTTLNMPESLATGTTPNPAVFTDLQLNLPVSSGNGATPQPQVVGGATTINLPESTGTGTTPNPALFKANLIRAPASTGTGSTPNPVIKGGLEEIVITASTGTGTTPEPAIFTTEALSLPVSSGGGSTPEPTLTADYTVPLQPSTGTGSTPEPSIQIVVEGLILNLENEASKILNIENDAL